MSESSFSDIYLEDESTVTSGNNSRDPEQGSPTQAMRVVAEETRFCTRGRCIVMTILLSVAAVISTSLIVTNSANPLNYFILDDPPGAAAATRWDATAGLYLEVDIACDDTWADIVDQSILNWNVSEAVILTTRRVDYDADCTPISGRLKVCNGDYGDTDWHGINIAAVDSTTGMLVHAVSKLNDRFSTEYDGRLYLACHENGHGTFFSCVVRHRKQPRE
jgi:hypothetical protein